MVQKGRPCRLPVLPHKRIDLAGGILLYRQKCDLKVHWFISHSFIGPFELHSQTPSFRTKCNAAGKHVVLSETKSIEEDLSIPLCFSRDDDFGITT